MTNSENEELSPQARAKIEEDKRREARRFFESGGRIGWFEWCSLSPPDQDIFLEERKAWRIKEETTKALIHISTQNDPTSALSDVLDPVGFASLKLKQKLAESINNRARND